MCTFNNQLLTSGHLETLTADRVAGDKLTDRGTRRFTAERALLWDEAHWLLWLVLAAGVPETHARGLAAAVAHAMSAAARGQLGGAVGDTTRALAQIQGVLTDGGVTGVPAIWKEVMLHGLDVTTWVGAAMPVWDKAPTSAATHPG
jgi:hypothetical protein